eukprot:TRINITY_DN3072_c3_g2_i2.p1 TRINITY_DN3072_c3_g2~~TRINITY_DN3072_c3_g2_i2.p1  ORF type:complete len:785 (+),score=199.86 TRINITY_DN3072_c3_g2_i2:1747-4101(+)
MDADRDDVGRLLPPQVVRALADKLYEKRKLAALDVETLVKELVHGPSNADDKVRGVLQTLVAQLSESPQANSRKGGLIALAAAAIGLGSQECHKFISHLVPPVLKCFADADPRIRYYACESLYNIAKVARTRVLLYFNEIFDNLCKLSADPDPNVRNGAGLVDRLVKDIVSESEQFDVERFMPLLEERVHVINAYCRQFLIAWVAVLDSVPHVQLVHHLPALLDGLLHMLCDAKREIRSEAAACLAELLEAVPQHRLELAQLVPLLLPHAASTDEFTRQTAIDWLRVLVLNGGGALLPQAPQIVAVVLPSLSHDVADIRSVAQRANEGLMAVVRETRGAPHQRLPMPALLGTLIDLMLHDPPLGALRVVGGQRSTTSLSVPQSPQLGQAFVSTAAVALPAGSGSTSAAAASPPNMNTAGERSASTSPSESASGPNTRHASRLAALDWLAELHSVAHASLMAALEQHWSALLGLLRDPQAAEVVVRQALGVIGQVCLASDRYFAASIERLVSMFREDRWLLRDRASAIVRDLCVAIGAERVLLCLAQQVQRAAADHSDFEFATLIVQTLNLALLTAPELRDVRRLLQQLLQPQTTSIESLDEAVSERERGVLVLRTLYETWAYNPPALLALCLLSQLYQHAAQLVFVLGREGGAQQLSVWELLELDKLVQLLESPVFAWLRLQLLEPRRYPYLFKALYGLLMLLPQSTAFHTLHARLSAVTPPAVHQLIPIDDPPIDEGSLPINFAELLALFRDQRAKQAAARLRSEQSKSPMILLSSAAVGSRS